MNRRLHADIGLPQLIHRLLVPQSAELREHIFFFRLQCVLDQRREDSIVGVFARLTAATVANAKPIERFQCSSGCLYSSFNMFRRAVIYVVFCAFKKNKG
jgi:hypothetical protein